MNERKAPVGFWAGVTLAGTLALPAVYLFLLGPLAFLWVNGILSDDVWHIAAYPIWALENHIGEQPEWLWKSFWRYYAWWGNLGGGSP